MKFERSKICMGMIMAGVLAVPLLVFAAPSLQLSTYSGAPGSTVQVNGSQFGASTNVLVSLAGTSTGAAVSGGSFNATLTVPNVSAGNYIVLATSPQREQGSAPFYIQGSTVYYPHAQPSGWYLLPGQQLRFTGSGFAPNVEVSVRGGEGTVTATTDSSGNFATDYVTVPYRWQNSRQMFTVTSSNAGYDIPMTLTIGTFYPNLNPSTYYVGYSQSMSATATGFAPNELVILLINGSFVIQKAADSSGSVSFDFVAPSSGSTFTLTAQGFYSGVMSSRIITLH